MEQRERESLGNERELGSCVGCVAEGGRARSGWRQVQVVVVQRERRSQGYQEKVGRVVAFGEVGCIR